MTTPDTHRTARLVPVLDEALPATGTTGRTAAPGRAPRRGRRTLPLVLAAALGSAVLSPASSASADASGAEQGRTPAQGDAAAARSAGRTSAPAATPSAQVALAAPVRVLAAAAPTYRVRSGDTVWDIAARTGTSRAAIVAANGLDSRALLQVGQVLTLPTSAPKGSAPAPTGGGTWTVRPGDTVSAIAARTGVSQQTIVAANHLDSRAFIRVGQVLRLGAAAPSPAAPGKTSSPAASGQAPAGERAARSYTVRAGDTLSGVAARAGTSVAALRRANPQVGADALIRVGQRLVLPSGTATGGSSSVPSSFLGVSYPDATVAAARLNKQALDARSVPGRSAMRDIVRATARRYGVDAALAQAVAFQESSFDMRSVSPSNAVGVMQVIPSSGRWASQLAGRPLDLLDPTDNATAGVLILRELRRGAPDLPTAIAGYYQGAASVRERGLYADTRRYVASVQTLMAQYR